MAFRWWAEEGPLIYAKCSFFRIRTRLYKAMMNLKYSLKDVFLHVTKKDPLHPLLLPEVLEDLNLKFGQALAFMELCTNLERESEVFIDL